MKLYQVLANSIIARANCIKSKNSDWQYKHEETLIKSLDKLPHGSGLDGQWLCDFDKSNQNKIVLMMEYHAMNNDGYYDGWIKFSVSIIPDLISDIKMTITGNFGKYQDIKDYLYDTLNYALTREI